MHVVVLVDAYVSSWVAELEEQHVDDTDVGLCQPCCDMPCGHVSFALNGEKTCQPCTEVGKRVGMPRVEPPEVDMKPITESTVGYIPMAFPKLSPFGTGDYHDARGGLRDGKVSFAEWGRYALLWHDKRFAEHPRFRYWFLDTCLRMKTPVCKDVFLKINSDVQDLTLADLDKHTVRRTMVQQMATATQSVPGSIGERRRMRAELEAMVEQKEDETAELGENGGKGRLPAVFTTLTASVYKWEQLHRLMLNSCPPAAREQWDAWRKVGDVAERERARKEVYYKLAVKNPAMVAWYCALKLEMGHALLRATISKQMRSDVVPGKKAWKDELVEILSEEGMSFEVGGMADYIDAVGVCDDDWTVFEWSAGGMIHAHSAKWIVGSYRLEMQDEEEAEEAEEGDGGDSDVDNGSEEDDLLSRVPPEQADRLCKFYRRLYSEWNPKKTEAEVEAVGRRCKMSKQEQRSTPTPDGISSKTLLYLLKEKLDEVEVTKAMDELQQILGISDLGGKSQHDLLLLFLCCIAEWHQMHDYHMALSFYYIARLMFGFVLFDK